jgi:hypothetical protein
MITYVEAYRADGSQILGNLDGQFAYRGKDYFRTAHYRALRDGTPIKHRRVHHWQVMRNDRCIRIITNDHIYDKDATL